jgi:hypothetical protein
LICFAWEKLVLSATDVHCLVGLLSAISSPEAVEVELGARVYDSVAEELRDVDIILRYPDAHGGNAATAGREVKDHRRPLDVTDVEQLAAKLLDMPDLTSRSIVSASGYTSPAKRKAKARGISLLHLRSVTSLPGSELLQVAPDLEFKERTLAWTRPPAMIPNPAASFPEGSLSDSTQIVGPDHAPVEHCPTLLALYDRVQGLVLEKLKGNEDYVLLPRSTPFNVNQLVTLADSAALVIDDNEVPLKDALVSGEVAWTDRVAKPDFLTLVREGEAKPLVQCAITEHSAGSLIGIALGEGQQLRFINVAVSTRNREKVRSLRLR